MDLDLLLKMAMKVNENPVSHRAHEGFEGSNVQYLFAFARIPCSLL